MIVFVPTDLVASKTPLRARHVRLLVLAWLLTETHRVNSDDEGLRLASEWWPPDMLRVNATGPRTVVGVLTELVRHGLVGELKKVAGGFNVEVKSGS